MRSQAPLRPELAAVCRFVGTRQALSPVRRPRPVRGVLGELANGRGLQ